MGKSNNKNKSNQKEKDTKEKVIKTEKKELSSKLLEKIETNKLYKRNE